MLNFRRWLAGIAVVAVIFIAFGSLAISARDSDGIFSATEPVESAESAAPGAAKRGAHNYRCAECGVIESVREIDTSGGHAESKSPGRSTLGQRREMRDDLSSTRGGKYEITVRLQDGSTRVITDSQSAKWKNGARIKVITGINQ